MSFFKTLIVRLDNKPNATTTLFEKDSKGRIGIMMERIFSNLKHWYGNSSKIIRNMIVITNSSYKVFYLLNTTRIILNYSSFHYSVLINQSLQKYK